MASDLIFTQDLCEVSIRPSVILFFHDSRNAEKPRTDLQAGAFGREQIDFKADIVSFHIQIDDSAEHCESLGFSDC